MLSLTINGDPKDLVLDTATLSALLDQLKINPKDVVVDCNRVLYKGTDSLQLRDKDVLEIVRYIGGGSSPRV